jgi:predicted metal-dependent hydrolase
MEKALTDPIIRTRRRTLCLEIKGDASLVIRAPLRMPLGMIELFVAKKRPWIEEKQRIAREKLAQAAKKEFVNGEEFLYLGAPYRLSIIDSADTPFSFDRQFYLSRDHAGNARQLLIDWYRQEAQRKIRERLDHHSSLAALPYSGFKLTSAQKCWGSCTVRGSLNFSWRLIMAPLGVIDYVVVHEISHLAQRNHSKRFWDTVSGLLPGYQQYRHWLKDNGHLLAI